MKNTLKDFISSWSRSKDQWTWRQGSETHPITAAKRKKNEKECVDSIDLGQHQVDQHLHYRDSKGEERERGRKLIWRNNSMHYSSCHVAPCKAMLKTGLNFVVTPIMWPQAWKKWQPVLSGDIAPSKWSQAWLASAHITMPRAHMAAALGSQHSLSQALPNPAKVTTNPR